MIATESIPRLGLSIPLLNEEAVVRDTIHRMVFSLEAQNISFALALVNNGSRDKTGALIDSLAEDPRIHTVHLRQNAGYGGGILAGLQCLQQGSTPDVLGWCWGDGQVDPLCLVTLLKACEDGAPMAKAVRTRRNDGGFRTLQGQVYAKLLRQLGQTATDPHGCPKLFRRESLQLLDLQHTDWFIDAEAMLKACKRDWTIAEVPVTFHARSGGTSKVELSTVLEFCANLWKWRRKGDKG